MSAPRKERALRLRLSAAVGTLVLLCSAIAWAHERFVKHTLLVPLDRYFFRNSRFAVTDNIRDIQPHGFLGVNTNIWIITANAFIVLTAFLIIWFFRQPIEEFIQGRLLRGLRGKPQRAVHLLACYLTDRPVRNGVFHTLGQWSVIFFMRSPALVLMYSATADSLVMPSYPLDPKSAVYFKFAEVLLAILILTQTLLPLCGAAIFGTWLYLNRWGFMVGVDAVPVVTVAVVYISSPWNSHKLAITSINQTQMRFLRLVLGVGFFVLGWLKVFNHNLICAVADNYPESLKDPASVALGQIPLPWADVKHFARECYAISFGLAEVMSGFMVMMGIFTRVWTTIMAIAFTKLMLFVYGFEEIPHIYPIAGCLVVIFSNRLTSELDPIERVEERLGRNGKTFLQVALVLVFSVLVCFLQLFPVQFIISLIDRSNL